MLNGLDLFSGIGGFSLALKQWVVPKAYCEIDRYAQSVLFSRMSEGKLFIAPIWDDIKTLKGKMLPKIDMVYGGFPCQDISTSGNGVGLAGKRSGLYWEIERLVRETNPKYVFLENVPAIRTRGLNTIIQSFTEIGYDCRWTVLSAGQLGFPFCGKRWFFLASSRGERLERLEQYQATWDTFTLPSYKNIYDNWEKTLNKFSRVGHELPRPMDRIKALGNAVVPQQTMQAFKILTGMN